MSSTEQDTGLDITTNRCNTLKSMQRMTGSCNPIIIKGDLNCRKVKWESFKGSEENTLGN